MDSRSERRISRGSLSNVAGMHFIGGVITVFAGYPQAASLLFAIGSILLACAVRRPLFLIITVGAVLFFLGIGGWLDLEGWRFAQRPMDGMP